MRTPLGILGILLVAAAVHAQEGSGAGSVPPKAAKPAPKPRTAAKKTDKAETPAKEEA